MWRKKTVAEKLAEKKFRRKANVRMALLTALPALWLAATSPAWHGLAIGGLVLPIPRLVPEAVRTLLLIVLALGCVGWVLGRWLDRFALPESSALVCRKCRRVKANSAGADCTCGAKLEKLDDLVWVDLPGSPGGEPHPTDGRADSQFRKLVNLPLQAGIAADLPLAKAGRRRGEFDFSATS